MNEFNMTIRAKKFKHVISVIRRANDEAVFEFKSDGSIISRVMNPANVFMVQVTISEDALEHFNNSSPHKVGVDLDKIASIIRRASAKDIIEIKEFSGDSWFFRQGTHQRTISLLNPDRVKKCPATLDLEHTVSVRLSGKELKDIIANAGDIGSGWLLLRMGLDAATFSTESNDVVPDTYTATLPKDRVEILSSAAPAVTVYTLEFFQDITADILTTDDVVIKSATDRPCEIGYTRDDVEVKYILAPRVESD